MSATRQDEVGDGYLVRSLGITYRDGATIPAHRHPWGQLVYARSGVMRVTSEDTAWLVPPTRAVWLPPGRVHEIAHKGEVAMRSLYLAPELSHGRLADEAAVIEVSPLLAELIAHILRIGMLHPDRPAQARLAGVLVDLLAAAPPQDLALPLPRDRRARALAEHLRAAPETRENLGDLAREHGASLRTLQRLFPRETGLSLEAWRQKARLIHAVAALGAGAPVTHAALDCGYDSVSAFIAAFRRQFGVTPGRFKAAG